MEKENKEIPFGSKDSELYKFEYTIPEGYEARIEDGKVIVTKKDSEDERIRKMLIEQMERWKKCAEDNNVEQDVKDASDAIAYLEKRKEQKPIPTEDEKDFLEKEVKAFLCNYDKEFDDDAPTYDIAEHFYQLGKNSQKPAEWSEEDEKHLNWVIENFSQGGGLYDNLIYWLTQLPQRFNLQLNWKPSKEQMETLERWLLDNRFKGDSRYVYPIFESLYNDLKNYFSL